MRLILTRHGETVENKKRILQGHLPGHLTRKGIDQARRLARRLKTEHIDVIYASDLERAARTAREIAKYHKNVPFHLVKDLRERGFGPFEGKKGDDIDWLQVEEDLRHGKIPEAETKLQFYRRTERFLHKMLKKHTDDTVLWVAHGGNIIVVIASLIRVDHDNMYYLRHVKNTSVTILEIDEDKKHKLHLYDCTKHLR
jgi:broad specificity phosphatase PhoE